MDVIYHSESLVKNIVCSDGVPKFSINMKPKRFLDQLFILKGNSFLASENKMFDIKVI